MRSVYVNIWELKAITKSLPASITLFFYSKFEEGLREAVFTPETKPLNPANSMYSNNMRIFSALQWEKNTSKIVW